MEPNECLNKLFEVQVTTHVMHLQTQNYNDHKVLNEFYDGIKDLADCYAEQYQGVTGEIITGIGNLNIRESADPITYIEEFRTKVEEYHSQCEILTVKLVIENILTLTNKTLYLLKLA